MTHHIAADCAVNGRGRRARCGSWVRPHEHGDPPTCPECRVLLKHDAEVDLAMEAMVHGDTTTYVPKKKEPPQ